MPLGNTEGAGAVWADRQTPSVIPALLSGMLSADIGLTGVSPGWKYLALLLNGTVWPAD